MDNPPIMTVTGMSPQDLAREGHSLMCALLEREIEYDDRWLSAATYFKSTLQEADRTEKTLDKNVLLEAIYQAVTGSRDPLITFDFSFQYAWEVLGMFWVSLIRATSPDVALARNHGLARYKQSVKGPERNGHVDAHRSNQKPELEPKSLTGAASGFRKVIEAQIDEYRRKIQSLEGLLVKIDATTDEALADIFARLFNKEK